MKPKAAKLGASSLLAVASLALVVYVFVLDLERTSPGPLAAAHAQDPRLEAGASCAACHGRSGQSMADACAACHDEVGRGAAQGTGFHGALPPAEREACGVCHREHLGHEAPLAGASAFARAGFATREDYDHHGLGFVPTGLHAELTCEECHPRADAVVLAAGEPRFLGLDPSCAACHDDPHAGRMVQSCSACHDQARLFDDFSAYAHTDALPLVGAHARLACIDCHARDGAHAVELLAGPGPHAPARACVDCHESPHAAEFLQGAARLALDPALGRSDGGATCAACHDAEHGTFLGGEVDCPPALHAASGFALEPPHDEAECAACHGPATAPVSASDALARSRFDERFPGRAADDCAACHDDPHGDQFLGDAFASRGCVSCHGTQSFAPAHFDVPAHAETAFPLTGAHRQAECAECHRTPDGPIGAVPGSRIFEGTASACADCHEDPHTASDGASAWLAAPGDCSTCHTTGSFGEDLAQPFDHARWTGFALSGAHERASCESCHAPLAVADEHGRTFGRVEDRFGVVSDCASCHADPHVGAAWYGTDEAVGCDGCHSTESFGGPETRAFDHGRWTGFALDARHADVACAACHGRNEPSGLVHQDGAVFRSTRLGDVAEVFPGDTELCATCHGNPHGGAFQTLAAPPAGPPWNAWSGPSRSGAPAELLAGAASDCARCHTPHGFELPAVAFNHDWTRYELEGPHAELRCDACHTPHERDPETGRRFERARGSRCSDCHADPHAGQFGDPRVAERADCARCHASASALRFDHDDSRFPLDEQHAELDCAACHKPWTLPNGAEVVRYRPLGITCKDCHGTVGDDR